MKPHETPDQETAFAAAVRESGFDDEDDMIKCVGAADLRTPEKLAAFEKWKASDGTKSGLLKLPTMPKRTGRQRAFSLFTLATMAALSTGCIGPSSKQLPAIIAALAKDTNTCYLRVTSPTFGTLEFQRNMPAQVKGGL